MFCRSIITFEITANFTWSSNDMEFLINFWPCSYCNRVTQNKHTDTYMDMCVHTYRTHKIIISHKIKAQEA
jgi:hypothetical protein